LEIVALKLLEESTVASPHDFATTLGSVIGSLVLAEIFAPHRELIYPLLEVLVDLCLDSTKFHPES
jgi:hypothetical protein